MSTQSPDDKYIIFAKRQARTYAFRCGQLAIQDDFEQEVMYALYKNWPRLVKRYGPEPPMSLMRTAIKNWLIDYSRIEFGRNGALNHNASPLMEWNLKSDSNVEKEALSKFRTGPCLLEVVDILDKAYNKTKKTRRYKDSIADFRRRKTLILFANGVSNRDIAKRLGVTESMISKYIRDSIRALNADVDLMATVQALVRKGA